MPRYLSTNQIREMYLQFFESKEHLRYQSHPIPVYDDPTLMFSVAGMTQFKPFFIGAEPNFAGKGKHKRVVTAQKCIRIGDIENVGRTNRHCSFFEMLGNFSFDSYFKREAILWAWEFITSENWLGYEPEKMYVTIYKDDEESFAYWTKDVGLNPSHVNRFDADENFWPQNAPKKGPNGPCGPCSEIYYDRGETFGTDTWQDYAQNPESNRFLEIWNLVFPGYNRSDGPDGTGALEDLGRKNIDTGMGMVRVAMISQGVEDFYSTDDFLPLINKVVELSGKKYDGPRSVSHRVIAEHVRMVAMTLADGVGFGTGEREYVVRKVMRRASRHAYLLGLKEPVLYSLVPLVAQTLGGQYPEIVERQASVMQQMQDEEKRFLATLERGIERLDALLVNKKSGDELNGEDAFTLYDTFGFPLDLTREICEERNVGIDEAGFKTALKQAQELARAGSKYGKKDGVFGGGDNALEGIAATNFVGYASTSASAKIIAILKDGARTELAGEGETVEIILDNTPFYAEGGGQVGDVGLLENKNASASITDTQKNAAGVFVHSARVLRGQIKIADALEARVENAARSATERHHTATHLLQAALRATLGSHVQQKGSLVSPDRLRFDFTHNEAMTSQDIAHAEALVNRFVQANFAVTYKNMGIAEARASGATALFGEKYGDVVRVVSVDGNISGIGILEKPTEINSKELCGGTHVSHTGNIGAFVIVGEEGVAAGVRRLEALCGEAAIQFVRHNLDRTAHIARALSSTPEQLSERFAKLQDDLKNKDKELAALKQKFVQAQMGGNTNGNPSDTLELAGYKIVRRMLSGAEGNALRGAADELLEKTKADIVVIASEGNLVVKASKDATTRGAHAGQLIAKLAAAGGGKGGGRPDMAQAGVQDGAAALAALEKSF